MAVFSLLIFEGCAPTVAPITKGAAYRNLYKQGSHTVLILPPINKTNNVDAKDFMHGTLNMPLIDRGYYVMPLFLSADILRREGAASAEVFLNQPLNKFGEVFGADAVLFTTITQWQKNAVMSTVDVEVEYVLKSTRDNEVLFQRKGNIEYSTKVKVNNAGLAGLIASAALSVANTAATNFTTIGRICNNYTLSDIPASKYNPSAKIDSTMVAGPKEFKQRLGN